MQAGGIYFALGNFALASRWPYRFRVVCVNFIGYPTRMQSLVVYGLYSSKCRKYFRFRLGKLACPRVKDDHKKDVDEQILNSGRPHDY